MTSRSMSSGMFVSSLRRSWRVSCSRCSPRWMRLMESIGSGRSSGLAMPLYRTTTWAPGFRWPVLTALRRARLIRSRVGTGSGSRSMTSRSGFFAQLVGQLPALGGDQHPAALQVGVHLVPVEVGFGQEQDGVGRQGPDDVAGRVEQGGRLLGDGHELRALDRSGVSRSLADESVSIKSRIAKSPRGRLLDLAAGPALRRQYPRSTARRSVMLETILQSVGRTPLVKLRRLAEGLQAKVAVKVEAGEPRRERQGPRRPGHDRRGRAAGASCGRAGRSSRPPPATPASAWRWSRP